MKIILYVLKIGKNYKRYVIGLILIAIIASIFSMIIPQISGRFIDQLVYQTERKNIYVYCLIYAFLLVISIILGYIIKRIMICLSSEYTTEIRKKILAKLYKSYKPNTKFVDMVSFSEKVIRDSEQLVSFVLEIIKNIFPATILLIASFFILYGYNNLFGVIILLVGIIYIVSFKIIGNKVYKSNIEYKEEIAKYFSKICSYYKNWLYMIIHCKLQNFLFHMDEDKKNLYDKTVYSQKIGYLYTSLDSLINGFVQIMLFILGGISVLEGDLSIGEFSVMNVYFGLIMKNIQYFFGIGKTYKETLASFDRINRIFLEKDSIQGTRIINSVTEIKIRNLSITYNEGRKKIEYPDWTLKKGRIYGIHGRNGVGKSTLFYILLGIFNGYYDGKIEIDNINLNEINAEEFRKSQISYLEQQPVVLDNDIIKNLSYDSAQNRSEIEELFSVLNIDSLFGFKENNLYVKGKRSMSQISGGEIQKISLIRSLLDRDKSILMFDEADSALDTATKIKLFSHLNKIKSDKIILIISHLKDIENYCDEVLKL